MHFVSGRPDHFTARTTCTYDYTIPRHVVISCCFFPGCREEDTIHIGKILFISGARNTTKNRLIRSRRSLSLVFIFRSKRLVCPSSSLHVALPEAVVYCNVKADRKLDCLYACYRVSGMPGPIGSGAPPFRGRPRLSYRRRSS